MRDTCKHGHVGWMKQRYMYDRKREKFYWVWYCMECGRLRNIGKPRPHREQHKAAA